MSLTWARALAWRLRRHELAPPGDAPVEGVVDRLVALVARSEPAAELSVRLRQRDSRPGQLGAALVDGRVVKTYAFRGATHLMTPEQAATHLALRTASRMWELPSWQEYYRLAPTDWPDLRDAVRDALAAGPLTRAELGEAVAAEPRFAHLRAAIAEGQDTLVKPLAWHGVLSFGPSRAGRVTFAALEANPRWPGLPDLDDAGPRAVRAYLRAYGPATPGHLRYWLGQGLGAGRRVRTWLAELPDVAWTDVDGAPAAVLAEDLDELLATPSTDVVRLLPGHDQWVLGPGTADAHVVPPARRSAVTGGADVVVAAGTVSGTWSLGRDDDVTVTWFPEAGRPREAALEGEVARLAEILDRPLRLVLRPVG